MIQFQKIVPSEIVDQDFLQNEIFIQIFTEIEISVCAVIKSNYSYFITP